MFEHVEAQDGVEGVVGERQLGGVLEHDCDHRRGGLTVERDVGADERHVGRDAGQAVRTAADVEDRAGVVQRGERGGRVAGQPVQHQGVLATAPMRETSASSRWLASGREIERAATASVATSDAPRSASL